MTLNKKYWGMTTGLVTIISTNFFFFQMLLEFQNYYNNSIENSHALPT